MRYILYYPSAQPYKKPQNCRPRDMIPFALFYRKFVTKYLISAGRLTAQITKKSRYVHGCDKFMTWMTVLLMKGHALLDLILKNSGELVEDFGCLLQGPWDGGDQDTERKDEGKQQDSNLGVQERELWSVRSVLVRIPWETTLERGEFQRREDGWFETLSPPASRMVHSKEEEIKPLW